MFSHQTFDFHGGTLSADCRRAESAGHGRIGLSWDEQGQTTDWHHQIAVPARREIESAREGTPCKMTAPRSDYLTSLTVTFTSALSILVLNASLDVECWCLEFS